MRVWLIFLLLTVGCTTVKPLQLHFPDRDLVIHADTEFSDMERSEIHEATNTLLEQTGIRLEVNYDLDFRKIEQLSRVAGQPLLVRLTSKSDITREIDTHFRGVVYGWTITKPSVTVYVAADRLIVGKFATHVFLHEFLHVLGCDHTNDPDSVLYEITNWYHMTAVLDESDMRELFKHRPSQRVSSGE